MAELADAHGSGPCGSNTMRVQVSFPASQKKNFTKPVKFFFVASVASCYIPIILNTIQTDPVSDPVLTSSRIPGAEILPRLTIHITRFTEPTDS